jgi:glycine cleavage system H protein
MMMDNLAVGKLWVRREGSRRVIGLTEEAADEYGMILFVELPEPGDSVREGLPFLVVETAVQEQELVSPVTGLVLEVNRQAEKQPELIHRSPEGLGWLVAVEVMEPPAVEE